MGPVFTFDDDPHTPILREELYVRHTSGPNPRLSPHPRGREELYGAAPRLGHLVYNSFSAPRDWARSLGAARDCPSEWPAYPSKQFRQGACIGCTSFWAHTNYGNRLRIHRACQRAVPEQRPATPTVVDRWWKNNELPEQQARGECVKASVSTGAGDELAPAESAAAGASSRGRSGEADAAGGAAQKKPRSVAYAGSKGGRASPRTIARGAYARSAGVRASASTSAEGAYARSSGARASARTCAWSLCK